MATSRRRAISSALRWAAAGALPFAGLGRRAWSQGPDVTLFRIGTAGVGGTYYPVGGMIASVVSAPTGGRDCEEGGSCGVPGLIAVAQSSAGSRDNLERLRDGMLESALAQSDVAYAAFTASGPYEGEEPLEGLRLLASLYTESVHVVARSGLGGVEGVGDLKGLRVSVDVEGSGTRTDALLVLQAYGLGPGDVEIASLSTTEAAAALRRGELDAFFLVAGYPALVVSELAEAGAAVLLPIQGEPAERLLEERPFFARDLIPADAYPGVPAVPTLGVVAQWLTTAGLSDDMAYGLVRALWHPSARKLLDEGHAKAAEIVLENALRGNGVPLHDGAAEYYREAGFQNRGLAAGVTP